MIPVMPVMSVFALSPQTALVLRGLAMGINEEVPYHLLRQQCFVGTPRSAQAILFDRIGKPTDREISSKLLKQLSTALHGTTREATQVVELWRKYHTGKTRSLLTFEEWEQRQRRLQSILRDRLLQATPTPIEVELQLCNAPELVRNTFQNVVMGSGLDKPRESKAEIQRRVFSDSFEFRIQPVRKWEAFWENLAEELGWQIKPAGWGDPYILWSAIEYAQVADWTLLTFRSWLFERLEGELDHQHLLVMFDAVIDAEVLTGAREEARTRLTIPQILKGEKVGDEQRRKFNDWGNKWVGLAKKLEATEAIRPRQKKAVLLSQRRAAGKNRESIFLEASRQAFNQAQYLYHELQAAGLDADAAVAANILVGIHQQKRKSARQLRVPGYHSDTMSFVELRVEALARQYQFGLKRKPANSDHRGSSRKLGNRFREIEKAISSSISPTDFLELLMRDEGVRKEFTLRLKGFEATFRSWIARKKDSTPLSKLSLQKQLALAYALPLFSIATWWRRIDQWGQQYGW